MGARKLQVFVSSKISELAVERQAIKAALDALEVDAWVFEQDARARPNAIQENYLEEVAQADLYLGVFWKGYGAYTIEEFEHARQLGIPCLIYKKRAELEGPDPAMGAFLDEISQVESGLTIQWFDSAEQIGDYVRRDVAAWLAQRSRDHKTIKAQVYQITKGIKFISLASQGKIENFFEEYLGTECRSVPFDGRKDELAALDRWLADRSAPPYGLIAAGAGRGKSALLARWSQSVIEHDLADLAFVPISIRFDTAKASVCFPALAARLGEIYREPVAFADMTAEQWLGVCHQFMRRDPPGDKQVLIILDGLDETSDWQPDAGLFPLNPPDGVRVLVSARHMGQDVDGTGWFRRLNWVDDHLAASFPLPTLTQDDVREVLTDMGPKLAPILANPGRIAEIHRLSEGDPLLVRLYLEGLLDAGDRGSFIKLGDLAVTPAGLDGYFARWWGEQRELWGKDSPLKEQTCITVFKLLACALGSINQEDLLALAPEDARLNTWTLAESMADLNRFVIGDGVQKGYVFNHPRLGQHFYEKLTRMERRSWNRYYLDYGQQVLKELKDGLISVQDVPAYPLQYYGAHLERAGTKDEHIYDLVSEKWMRAWYEFDGMYSGFLNDVDRVWKRAKNAFLNLDHGIGAQLGWLIKCGLCKSSVAALNANIQPELLRSALQENLMNPTQVLVIISQTHASDQKAQALQEVAAIFPNNLMGELLTAAQAIDDKYYRAEALGSLALHLPEGLLDEVLTTALAIEDEYYRAEALNGLAPHLPETLLEEALVAAQAIQEGESRAEALGGLLPFLPETLLEEALESVLAVDDEFSRAEALSKQALHLPERRVETMLAEARAIDDPSSRAIALSGLAPHLPEALLAETLAAVQTIEHESDQVSFLVRLVPYLPERLLETAWSAAQAIENEFFQADVLCQLAPFLPEALLGQVLAGAQNIKHETYRADALSRLAPYLPEGLLETALLAALDINDESSRASAIGGLAAHLPAELLENALFAALDIDWEFSRAKALNGLAPYLPEALLEEALTAAQAIQAGESRADALSSLAPHLPKGQRESVLGEALVATQLIEVEHRWVEALNGFAPYLPEECSTQLLSAAQAISNSYLRADALSGIAPSLPEGLLGAALSSAQAIDDPGDRVFAVSGLVPCLPDGQQADVLQGAIVDARAILDPQRQTLELIRLVPHLPEAQQDAVAREALAAAQAIRDEMNQSAALSELAPHLPEALLGDAFKASQTIQDDYSLAAALSGLAPYLPTELLAEALETAQTIEDEYYRIEALGGLAPYLPESRVEEMLAATQDFTLAGGKAVVLSGLAPHLSEAMLKEALAAAQASRNENQKTRALCRLAPYLPKAMLDQALATARAMRIDTGRVEALNALAPYLPESQRGHTLMEALAVALVIEFDYSRESALDKLVPNLIDQYSCDQGILPGMIEGLSIYPRPTFIGDLVTLLPFMRSCIPDPEWGSLMVDIWQAITEIRHWWP